MKPRRNTRLIARPVWSGPSENRNVAKTPCLRNSSTRFGTPSRVPRSVSTSTLSASLTASLSFDERPRHGDVPAIRLEDVGKRTIHRDGRSPLQVSASAVDLRHAILHVLITFAVIAV